MTTEKLTLVERHIALCESELFTGTHSESFITNDLQTRRASDRYSTMGSNPCQTYLVTEKKQVYNATFDDAEKNINYILSNLEKTPQNNTLIYRCERCKNQIVKLRNLVRNF